MSWGGLVFDPILAPLIGWQAAAWLAALVAVLAVLALAVALWRGLRGAWWRGLALGLIAAALAGPGLERGTARPLSDIVLLVDDRSASQTLPGRREQADAAMARIEEQLGQWPGTEIRRITLGDAEDGTLLGAALSRAIAEEPANRLSGVLVLSDGLAHDGAALPATVIPFLLRGVNLLGIDSVMRPYADRVRAWSRLSRDLPLDQLERMIRPATLSDLPALGPAILKGQVQGRVVVDVRG